TGTFDIAFGFAFVQKFSVGRIIATKNQAVVPPGKITDHLEIGRPWSDTPRTIGCKSAWKIPKHPVHGHQVIRIFLGSYISDPRPFRIPTMSPIVTVTCFGKPEKFPAVYLMSNTDKHRFMVPPCSPDRIGRRI